MRQLPEIRDGGHTWRLPLSEATARLLVYRYLDPMSSARSIDAREVENTLLIDPAFALWCLAHLTSTTTHSIVPFPIAEGNAWSLHRLAIWFLSVDLSNLLAVEKLGKLDGSPNRFRRLAQESLSAATAMVGGKRRIRQKPNGIAALLHNAPRWFTPTDGKLGDFPVPDSLLSAIRAASKGHRKSEPSTRKSRKTQKRIRRAWPSGRTPWSDLLALAMENVVPRDSLQLEKLAAMRQLAYGASHEINNPLANISTRAQMLIRTTDDRALIKHLTAINDQAFRAHEMIADLMFFAKPPPLDLSCVHLDRLVRDVVAQVKESASDGGAVAIHQDLLPLQVRGDRAQLAMAVKAILQNALGALRGQGTVWITAGPGNTNGAARSVRLAIRDDGPGLSADVRRHLFDPFFSGREAGRGLGFGLSKAWRIVQLHAGQITASCPTDGGAQFTIELPQDGQTDPARQA
jgi:signal transduction histidine kinase